MILDRAQAIAWGLDQASEGDTVVLAGMGDRLYPNSNSKELPWDDGDVARHILSGTFASTAASPHRRVRPTTLIVLPNHLQTRRRHRRQGHCEALPRDTRRDRSNTEDTARSVPRLTLHTR